MLITLMLATSTALAPGEWQFLGERRKPASLKECRPGATVVHCTNVGTGWPWKCFCYRSGGAK